MSKNTIKAIIFLIGLVIVLAAIYAIAGGDLTENEGMKIPKTWQRYENQEIGISLAYPPEAEVEEGAENDIQLSLWGPTQEPNTEFYDGISISIRKVILPEGENLSSIIERDLESVRQLGQIISPLKNTIFAGREARTFEAETLGKYTALYIPAGEDGYLNITYMFPDPTNQGFRSIGKKILNTVSIDESIKNAEELSRCDHSFEDFRVQASFEGNPAPVNFDTAPDAQRFRTVINNAVLEGPNYADHYTVASWGCGTNCSSGAIINAKNGKIVAYGIIATHGLSFQEDSRLLIVNPKENIRNDVTAYEGLSTDYYELTANEELKFLCKDFAGEKPICAQIITTAINPATGETREFGTPCDVPSGWQVVEPNMNEIQLE